MKIIILGAGVIGVTSAWYLARAGHQVTVIERHAGAGLETSFANGGQISVSHAMPWANPSAPWAFITSLFDSEAPLLYHLRYDRELWQWSLQFLYQCLPQNTRRNTEIILQQALVSRQCLRELRAQLPQLNYQQLERGILHFATSKKIYQTLIDKLSLCPQLKANYPLEVVDATACHALEPALAKRPIYGGIYAPLDESGDAHMFTNKLAVLAEEIGVQFLYQHEVSALQVANNSIKGVWVSDNNQSLANINQINNSCKLSDLAAPTNNAKNNNFAKHHPAQNDTNKILLHADAYVIALGCASRQLMKMVNIDLPIYPAKGYSVSFPLQKEDFTAKDVPSVSLLDEEKKLVFSRLGDVLRVAGTAEFCGYDWQIAPQRVRSIVRRAQHLFPHLRQISPENILCWSGLRPLTPSNIPCVGKSSLDNLWLNCGHGTLGWTLACGSAKHLSHLINNI